MERNCSNCISYIKNECRGTGLCKYYEPQNTASGEAFWPQEMRSSRFAAKGHRSLGKYYYSKPTAYNKTRKDKSQKNDPVLPDYIDFKEYPNPMDSIAIGIMFHECVRLSFDINIDDNKNHMSVAYTLRYKTHSKTRKIYEDTKSAKRGVYVAFSQAVTHIIEPITLCVITDESVDLSEGFRKSSPYYEILQSSYRNLKRRQCKLIHVRCKREPD